MSTELTDLSERGEDVRETRPFISTTAEQQAYNQQVCTECGLQRWQHIQAIMCTEHQTTLDDLLVEIVALRNDVAAIKSFVDQLETAVKSHPMGKMLLQ